MLLLMKITFNLGSSHSASKGCQSTRLSTISFYFDTRQFLFCITLWNINHGEFFENIKKDMMAHSISDMENYFSELEDFITLSDNDKVHLFHSSMLEILILKVFFFIL